MSLQFVDHVPLDFLLECSDPSEMKAILKHPQFSQKLQRIKIDTSGDDEYLSNNDYITFSWIDSDSQYNPEQKAVLFDALPYQVVKDCIILEARKQNHGVVLDVLKSLSPHLRHKLLNDPDIIMVFKLPMDADEHFSFLLQCLVYAASALLLLLGIVLSVIAVGIFASGAGHAVALVAVACLQSAPIVMGVVGASMTLVGTAGIVINVSSSQGLFSKNNQTQSEPNHHDTGFSNRHS